MSTQMCSFPSNNYCNCYYEGTNTIPTFEKLKTKNGKRGSLFLMDSDNSVNSFKNHDSLWKKLINLIFAAASICTHFCMCNSALMLKDPHNRQEGTECSFVAC